MTIEELGLEIAKGLVETGVEGGYGAVSCSTAGDYPSVGIQQLEGERANELFSMIDGMQQYIDVHFFELSYSDLEDMSLLLESEQGQIAQLEILGRDCETYAQACINGGLTDARAVIYAGIWCPTSHYCVERFISKRINNGYDMDDLYTLATTFAEEYASAVDCDEYAEGYANRAWNTYNYVRNLDLSEYGY